MADDFRQYMTLRASEAAVSAYRTLETDTVKVFLDRLLGPETRDLYRVIRLPPLGQFAARGERVAVPPTERFVCALTFPDERSMRVFRDIVARQAERGEIYGVGIDLAFQVADMWCPSESPDPIFSDRSAASNLIDAASLSKAKLAGDGVNVVIVDEGFSAARFPDNFVGGWQFASHAPGSHDGDHARLIARNVLSIAPRARLFDCPILPPQITNVPQFSSDMHQAYETMLTDVSALASLFGSNWIFVNAWAIYNRKSEASNPGDYTNNPAHPFNDVVARLVNAGVDVVFAAGNCGQFCPHELCGPKDTGPGESILGANSHPKVLTVGAVRSDGKWLGFSSQGPGQSKLDRNKPDLCAPSQFHETDDAYMTNTGTSTSCALVAGIVAALRSRKKWNSTAVPPDAMKGVLNASARRPHGGTWDRQLGHGIIDAGKAYDKVKSLYP